MKSAKLFLLLMLLCSRESFSQTAKDSIGAQFEFITKRAYDFGGVTINTNVSYQFQFKNSGDQPLVIKEIHASPKGLNSPPYKMILSYTQSPIKPGKKGIIEVTFIAQGDVGSFKNEILVNSNATTANYPLLYITGAVVPVHEHVDGPQPEAIIPVDFLVPVIRANTK